MSGVMKMSKRSLLAIFGISTLALTLASCLDSGGASTLPLTVSGTAATGAAMANTPVAIKCADGSQSSTTTAADGTFSSTFSAVFPCLLEATAPSGKFHSIANGSGNLAIANITPLTEALVGKFSADTAAYFAQFNNATAKNITGTAISSAQNAVIGDLTNNGITVPGTVTDLIATKLVAANGTAQGDDYDKLLDQVGAKTFSVKIIAMNDFHGNIQAPSSTNGGTVTLPDPNVPAGTKVNVGGASYVASAVKALKSQNMNNVVVGAGDLTGASPFASSITHDEATVDILNQIGMEVTSVGNHEFDYGKTEILRKQNGGCYPAGNGVGVVGTDTCLMDASTGTYSANGGSFSGAKFKYLSANVVDNTTNSTLFPATFIKRFGPVAVGFIGLTLQGTTQLVSSSGVADLTFNEESSVINTQAKNLKAAGVQAVVVLIHQGGVSTATTVNDKTCPVSFGDLGTILDKLSADVDVIVSGHSHQEYVCNYKGAQSGKSYLVTQTGFYGGAVTDITLNINPKNGIVGKTANTVPVIQADNNSAVTVPQGFLTFQKDAAIDTLVGKYVAVSNTLAQKQVGTISANITRALFTGTTNRDESAEGAMGGVVADAYLYGVPGGADFAVVNPGGVRADLTCAQGSNPPCPVSFSQVNTVAPFGNTLTKLTLTGAQIIRLLEQQWEAPNCTAKFNPATLQYGRILQVSSTLNYTFDNSVNQWTTGSTPNNCAAAGAGARVVVSSVKIKGVALDVNKTYTLVTNNFLGLGSGGDNFTVMAKQGQGVVDTKVLDLDALISYFKDKSPVAPPTPRITRVN